MASRILVWSGFGVALVSAVALAGYMVVVGLDKAAKTATVVGVFLTLLGLLVAVTALLINPRKPRDPDPDVRQSADGAVVRRRLGQVVKGGTSSVEQSAREASADSLDQRVER
ncbi:hypothetical protein [Nocardia sp. NPDC052566]|uniref:hypothetical protein n=1 Tax=Nocardia sp. NPDC052566 TaxID=3364330 RepID=UPI0037CCA542